MSVRKIILILLVLACITVCAGCISDTDNPAVHPANPVQKVGELRGMYLSYVDEETGDSWWADLKTKVGSSVLSLKGPDISVKDEILTDEKKQILETALKLSSMPQKTGLNFTPVNMSENLPGDLKFWADYTLSRYPRFGTMSVTAEEWKTLWPMLKDAFRKISSPEIEVQLSEPAEE